MRIVIIVFLAALMSLLLIIISTPSNWSINVLLNIQAYNSPSVVFFLQKITNSISFVSIGVPITILAVCEAQKDRSKRKPIIMILLCVALSGLASSAIKNAVKKPRPFTVDARVEKLSGGGSYSFPSGHTTEAVSVAIMMIFIFRQWYVIVLYSIWVLIIMYSRMALGVHDLIDLIGGIVVASGSILLFFGIGRKFKIL